MATTDSNAVAAAAAGPVTDATPDTEAVTPRVGRRFEMRQDGLYREQANGKEWTLISAPFEVVGRLRDADGHGWSKVLRWPDSDGHVRELALRDAHVLTKGHEVTAALADMGLTITHGSALALAEYLSLVDSSKRLIKVERTGWHNIAGQACFVLPSETIGSPSSELPYIEKGSNLAAFEAKGSLDDWKDQVASSARGQSRLILAVSAALAGPLLHIMDTESGGIHLFGASSTGKTTAAEAAASVWGRGEAAPGFVRTWRATSNAMEGTASLHSDTVLVLDEIGVADPREIGLVVYSLASGAGKGRSSKDGSLRVPMTWKVMIISTGEVRMSDVTLPYKQRQTAGQAVRIVDVPADAGKGYGAFDHAGPTGDPKALSGSIKLAARSVYGTAGPAFASRILSEGLDPVRGIIGQVCASFRRDFVPAGSDGQVLRVADRFALIAAAGEIAITFGILPWPEGEARWACGVCFKDWLFTRGGAGSQEAAEAIERVRSFIEAHGDSRFQRRDDPDDRRVIPNRAGFTEGTGKDRVWMFNRSAWNDEVCAGADPNAVARRLAEQGMLKLASNGERTKPTRIDNRTERLYHVTVGIFEADADV